MLRLLSLSFSVSLHLEKNLRVTNHCKSLGMCVCICKEKQFRILSKMRQCNPHHHERIYRRSFNYLIWSFRSNSGHYKERLTNSKDIVLNILTQVDCGVRIRTIMTAIVASDVVRITLLNGLMDDRNTDSQSKSIRADGAAHVNASLIRRSRRLLLYVIYEMIGQQLMLLTSWWATEEYTYQGYCTTWINSFCRGPSLNGQHRMSCLWSTLWTHKNPLFFFNFRSTHCSDASSAVIVRFSQQQCSRDFPTKTWVDLPPKQRRLSLWILAASIYRTIKFIVL